MPCRELVQRGHDTVGQLDVGLGAGRRKTVGILEVAIGGARESLVEFREAEAVPRTAMDLLEPRVDDHFEVVMLGDQNGTVQRTTQRARVDRRERIAAQIRGDRLEPRDTFGGEIDIVIAVDPTTPLRFDFAVATEMDASRASRRRLSQESFPSFGCFGTGS